jgi:hypothetical protein
VVGTVEEVDDGGAELLVAGDDEAAVDVGGGFGDVAFVLLRGLDGPGVEDTTGAW